MATFPSNVGISNSFQDNLASRHLLVPVTAKLALGTININNTFLDQKQSKQIQTVIDAKTHIGGISLPFVVSTTSTSTSTFVKRRVLGVLFFRSKK